MHQSGPALTPMDLIQWLPPAQRTGWWCRGARNHGSCGRTARATSATPAGCGKRLNLRLFIHARHQRALRRVQIEPDDMGQLGVEPRVAAELEAFDSVRLEPILLPDAMDGGRRQPHLLGQAPRAPMGRRLGLAQRRADYRLLFGRGNSPRAAHTRLGAQSLESRAPICAAATDKPWSRLPQAARPDRVHSHPPRCPTRCALSSPAPEGYSAPATSAPTRLDRLRLFPPSISLRPCCRRTCPTFTSET